MASLDEFAREQATLTALKLTGQVAVNELSAQFGVSTVTVRKDLEVLERRNLLRRVRGGAVSVGASDEGAFEMRLRHAQDSKRAIAKAAATLVADGDVIAIDSSTSTFYLAQEILDRRNLIVITNGLRHAMLFMEQSSAMVLMPGGVLRRSAGSLVGPIGDVLKGRGRIGKGFFGLVGISTTTGPAGRLGRRGAYQVVHGAGLRPGVWIIRFVKGEWIRLTFFHGHRRHHRNVQR